MTTQDEIRDLRNAGIIDCDECGLRVDERGGIAYDPLFDEWLCLDCQGAELATEALGVDVVAENLGFTTLDTGGGCRAFSKVLHDGTVLMITGEDGSNLPEDGEENCILGHYTDDSLEEWSSRLNADVDECFEIAHAWWSKARSKYHGGRI